MISLSIPSGSDSYYFNMGQLLFGPYDLQLVPTSLAIPLELDVANLTGSRSMYGENNVVHDKVSGTVQYHPLLNGAIPSPTLQYPHQLQVPVYDLSYTPAKAVMLMAQCGVAVDGGCSRVNGSATQLLPNTVCTYRTFKWDPVAKTWTYFTFTYQFGSPTRISSVSRTIILSTRWYNKSNCYATSRYTSWSTGTLSYIETGIDWSKDHSYEEFFDKVMPTLNGLRVMSESTGDGATQRRVWLARDVNPFSPTIAKDKINRLVATLFPAGFPLEEKHYGDLAMEASAKTNANHANMIAFLRDLKNPSEMIPKLKELKSIKGIANNYLTVNYGILPTISDLKKIVRALEGVKAYIDRNGFDTYSAGYTTSGYVDKIKCNLEQHIKLAIGNEDSELLSLLDRLDSMGTLPTFERLWDLVPYSFVVDWFTDIGGLLQRVDAGLRLARLNIRYVTCSRKTVMSGVLPSNGLNPYTGTVKWEHYHRWVSDQCPVPPLSLTPNSLGFNHWLESSALILQRAKK